MKGLEKLVDILQEKAKEAAKNQYSEMLDNIEFWFKDDGMINFQNYVEQYAQDLIKKALSGNKEALRDIGIHEHSAWDSITKTLAENNKELVENERIKKLERMVKSYQSLFGR